MTSTRPLTKPTTRKDDDVEVTDELDEADDSEDDLEEVLN